MLNMIAVRCGTVRHVRREGVRKYWPGVCVCSAPASTNARSRPFVRPADQVVGPALRRVVP